MRDYEDRFMFHANAVPFGARFSTPLAVETRGATALASIGGRATASECGYLLDGGFVRFESVGSEVVGEVLPGKDGITVFRTRATTWIKRLRIAGLLDIGDLSVMLESQYDMRGHEPPHEPSFLGLKVERGGLSVCGQPWSARESPELGWMNSLPTFQLAQEASVKERAGSARTKRGQPRGFSLDQVYCAGRKGRGPHQLVPMSDPGALKAPEAISLFGLEPPALKPELAVPSPKHGSTHKRATYEPAVGGFCLEWPKGDATIRFYFGEYVVSRGYRRFTAVRMVMTRSPRSQLVIGEVALNGSKVP